jgi:hypothetical protein
MCQQNLVNLQRDNREKGGEGGFAEYVDHTQVNTDGVRGMSQQNLVNLHVEMTENMQVAVEVVFRQ